MLLLGAHVSTSGGVQMAPINGQNLGCTSIQIFSKNQRQWSANPLTDEEVSTYFDNLKKSNIKSVVAHDSYLINMATPDEAMRKKSLEAFIDELERADKLKLNGLVFHPGSHKGEGEEKGIAWLAGSLNRAADAVPGGTAKILIEITAGQGGAIGYTFEHLRAILDGVEDKKRFGICLDTCHMFGAGYSIATQKAYKDSMQKLDAVVGLKNVGCIHMNDSKIPLGSRKDRHENIGNGLIGKAGFGFIMNDKRLEDVPKILETPGGDEWYAKDLKILRKLIKKKAA